MDGVCVVGDEGQYDVEIDATTSTDGSGGTDSTATAGETANATRDSNTSFDAGDETYSGNPDAGDSPGAVETSADVNAAADTQSDFTYPDGWTGGNCPVGMVPIPGGSFTPTSMGVLTQIKPFCIDINLVTVGDYVACTTCTQPSATRLPSYCNWSTGDGGTPASWANYPINCVTGDLTSADANDSSQAEYFCQLIGKRLPTAPEFEWVARNGPEGTTYPAGNDVASEANACVGRTVPAMPPFGCPVGQGTANSFGVYDLDGNVQQWTTTPDPANPPNNFTGSEYYQSPLESIVQNLYQSFPANAGNVLIGFRCVKNLQ